MFVGFFRFLVAKAKVQINLVTLVDQRGGPVQSPVTAVCAESLRLDTETIKARLKTKSSNIFFDMMNLLICGSIINESCRRTKSVR